MIIQREYEIILKKLLRYKISKRELLSEMWYKNEGARFKAAKGHR